MQAGVDSVHHSKVLILGGRAVASQVQGSRIAVRICMTMVSSDYLFWRAEGESSGCLPREEDHAIISNGSAGKHVGTRLKLELELASEPIQHLFQRQKVSTMLYNLARAARAYMHVVVVGADVNQVFGQGRRAIKLFRRVVFPNLCAYTLRNGSGGHLRRGTGEPGGPVVALMA